ncbi:helix-turn-helix transcriptional regulator [Acinetobacter towneri]|uniref:XRE family transcriptional regulator n=1 Tax=Acinetobacter towneri TaxID=202956 RepID=UPI002578E8AF|nr:S24 family peptidase [Acinetobacter towneri]MDM1736682.1 helix-turn-helix transcriptional regulator [Acinetobacter towneri]
MTLGNRIRQLRMSQGLKQPALAKKAGVAQSTISDLENDKKSASADIIQALAQALNTTQDYLMTGKMPEAVTVSADQQIPSFGNSDDIEIRYFEDLAISCGFGSFGEVLERDAKTITINRKLLQERGINKRDCIALQATGESMYPTIKDKDIVYVDLARNNIKDGKVFAICHGGLFKFKRLYQLPLGGVRIVSDNSIEFPEERLTAQEIIDQQFEVIGWAWSWQSMEIW